MRDVLMIVFFLVGSEAASLSGWAEMMSLFWEEAEGNL